MTEGEIMVASRDYAEKVIKHKMAVHDVFNYEQAFDELTGAFTEGADFMYYTNNKELKSQLTEKDKQIEELKERLVDEESLVNENYRIAKQIEELKTQIEKMKKCENCEHWHYENGDTWCELPHNGANCNDFDKWE